MDGDAIMVGCAPTVIPSVYLHHFIDLCERFEKSVQIPDRDLLREYDAELRTIYYDIREEPCHPCPPQLHNTDRDPLQLTKLHFALNCTPSEALDALTRSGRERLDVLFLQFEQHTGSPQHFSPDVSALRRALGLG